jgi:hypothetical protein
MSPDLNMIEPYCGYLKNPFVTRDWFTSASDAAQKEAKPIIEDEIGQQGYFLLSTPHYQPRLQAATRGV